MKTERQRQHEQYKKRIDKEAKRRRQAKEWEKAHPPRHKPRFWWELLAAMALVILL